MSKRPRTILQSPVKNDTDKDHVIPRRYVNFYPQDVLFKITSIKNDDTNIKCLRRLSFEDCKKITDTYVYEALIRHELYTQIKDDNELRELNGGALCIGEYIAPKIIEVDTTDSYLELYHNSIDYKIYIDDRFKLMLGNKTHVLVQLFSASPNSIIALNSSNINIVKLLNLLEQLYTKYEFVHWDLHKHNYLIDKTTGNIEIIDFDMSWIGNLKTNKSLMIYEDALKAFNKYYNNKYSDSLLGHFLDIGNVIVNNKTELINKMSIEQAYNKIRIPQNTGNKYFEYNIKCLFYGMSYYNTKNSNILSRVNDENYDFNQQIEVEATQIINYDESIEITQIID